MLFKFRPCWEIGRHIVEFEQGGSARAEYGARLLQTLAASLATEFGRGFDVSNLRYMRLFFNAFPIRDASASLIELDPLPHASESRKRFRLAMVYERSRGPGLDDALA